MVLRRLEGDPCHCLIIGETKDSPSPDIKFSRESFREFPAVELVVVIAALIKTEIASFTKISIQGKFCQSSQVFGLGLRFLFFLNSVEDPFSCFSPQ